MCHKGKKGLSITAPKLFLKHHLWPLSFLPPAFCPDNNGWLTWAFSVYYLPLVQAVPLDWTPPPCPRKPSLQALCIFSIGNYHKPWSTIQTSVLFSPHRHGPGTKNTSNDWGKRLSKLSALPLARLWCRPFPIKVFSLASDALRILYPPPLLAPPPTLELGAFLKARSYWLFLWWINNITGEPPRIIKF